MKIVDANNIKHYAVDLGHNVTLPCTVPHKDGQVQWSSFGKNTHSHVILNDGSLQILDVSREDAGLYSCTPEDNASVKQDFNLTVRSK